jgi:hypothetical protein
MTCRRNIRKTNASLHSIRMCVPVNDTDKETAMESSSLKVEESVIRQLNGSGYGHILEAICPYPCSDKPYAYIEDVSGV